MARRVASPSPSSPGDNARGLVIVEKLLVQALSAPLTPACAAVGLALQSGLGLPAKIMLGNDGEYRLAVEIVRDGSGRDAETVAGRARATREEAVAWLIRCAGTDFEAELPVNESNGSSAVDVDALRTTTDALGWKLTEIAPLHYSVAAGAIGTSGRLTLTAIARTSTPNPQSQQTQQQGPLHGSCFVKLGEAKTLVGVEGTVAADALTAFAQESNARLRLARVGVEPDRRGTAKLSWQAVVPTDGPLEQWLAEALAAVSFARSATLDALRALAAHDAAESYLGLRKIAAVQPYRPIGAGYQPPSEAATL